MHLDRCSSTSCRDPFGKTQKCYVTRRVHSYSGGSSHGFVQVCREAEQAHRRMGSSLPSSCCELCLRAGAQACLRRRAWYCVSRRPQACASVRESAGLEERSLETTSQLQCYSGVFEAIRPQTDLAHSSQVGVTTPKKAPAQCNDKAYFSLGTQRMFDESLQEFHDTV